MKKECPTLFSSIVQPPSKLKDAWRGMIPEWAWNAMVDDTVKILKTEIPRKTTPIDIERRIKNRHEKRRNTYATTNESSPCTWWSKANPEHISIVLNMAGVPPEQINKYLNEKFGNNCYNVELKTTAEHHDPNFNTHLNCIPPYLIKNVRKCKRCVYTGREDPE